MSFSLRCLFYCYFSISRCMCQFPVQVRYKRYMNLGRKCFPKMLGHRKPDPLAHLMNTFFLNFQHKNNPSNNTNTDQKKQLLVFHPASSRNRTILRSHCDGIRSIETLQPVTVTWPNKNRSKDKQTFFKIYPLIVCQWIIIKYIARKKLKSEIIQITFDHAKNLTRKDHFRSIICHLLLECKMAGVYKIYLHW